MRACKRLQHFARRNFALRGEASQVGDVERRQIGRGHSTTFVTMKRPFACRGALLNASSAVNQARGSSSRKTLKMGTACAAASTWLDIRFPQFLRVFQDPPELRLKKSRLLLGQIEPREFGDVRHVDLIGLGHAAID